MGDADLNKKYDFPPASRLARHILRNVKNAFFYTRVTGHTGAKEKRMYAARR